jgi:2'-5' RNA ligase
METTRRQLSLYVPGNVATELEAVRRILDPIQSRLIPAHVTLCREDELGKISGSEVQDRLANPQLRPITLRFGRPEVFFGHGVLLSCIAGEEEFRGLREQLLGSRDLRDQRPHITLAHPRNPKSPGNCLSNTSRLPEVTSITFSTLCLIEQKGSEPWKLLQTFELPGENGSAFS